MLSALSRKETFREELIAGVPPIATDPLAGDLVHLAALARLINPHDGRRLRSGVCRYHLDWQGKRLSTFRDGNVERAFPASVCSACQMAKVYLTTM